MRRKSTVSAISSRLVQRFRSSGFIAAMLDAVYASPGAMAFTRIPRSSSLKRERAGKEPLNSRLGAVIGDHVGLRLAGPCEVDDDTVPGRLQMREGCARCQKRAQQVAAQTSARQSSRLCSNHAVL